MLEKELFISKSRYCYSFRNKKETERVKRIIPLHNALTAGD
jgi:hypothetical protein